MVLICNKVKMSEFDFDRNEFGFNTEIDEEEIFNIREGFEEESYE